MHGILYLTNLNFALPFFNFAQVRTFFRSLASRGELLPIYEKAQEKAVAEAEKRKKEKV